MGSALLLFVRKRAPLLIALFFSWVLSGALAQDCSATNLCATGCCSKDGYCGVGEEYCEPGVCVANCDYTATTECDENKHCALGCCSKFGVCGLGPDYCSKDNCVSTCDAKSECDPGDWGSTYAAAKTCPLNVCCSKYGFCGTTEEFCGKKKVQKPSCVQSQSIQRVIGYYEGWSPTRPCNPFYPEQIPLNIYTHLNFAFATVNPTTYEVGPANEDEGKLMRRLVDLKRKQTDLQVNIAIGGWSFNDPGPTQTVFSDLAASESNQKKFFKSLVSFMSTYGFDGVDIDWEYPAADDRFGRPEDFENFPKFMANLKSALKSLGARNELTLTLPTSYWYLQHFDIKALAKSVDYFNYMSYDLRGKWDRESKWTGPFLDSHTNLTEIGSVMDLLWRNDIQADKVALGLAFYGRTFTLADRNCKEPGCRFASGGKAGDCSREAGILTNSELDDIRAGRNLKPTLDKDAAVKILTWDDQWVTYDDFATIQLKLEFVRETCLGGVMVWAVSHDSYDGTYSRALAGLTPRPAIMAEYASDTTIMVPHRMRQCKWTGCGETCAGDYVAVYRSDGGGGPRDLMMDGTGCEKGIIHTLCCPKEDVPVCGWYGFNNGKCDSTCPSGMFEIGSYSGDCNNRYYQAACCEMNHDSTRLYWKTTEWSEFPNCNKGGCPFIDDSMDYELTRSDHGSGGGRCRPTRYGITYGPFEWEQRALCYNSNVPNMTWDGCDWFDSAEPVPYGKKSDYCVSKCKGDKIRLSMSDNGPCLNAGGWRSFCCDDNYYVPKAEKNPEIDVWKDKLTTFMEKGTCSAALDDVIDSDTALATREQATDDIVWLAVVLASLLQSPSYTLKQDKEVEQWNEWVNDAGFDHLHMTELKKFVLKTGQLLRDQAIELARDILCRMAVWNRMINGDELAECSADVCAEDVDPDLCEDDDAVDVDVEANGESSGIEKRMLEKWEDLKSFKGDWRPGSPQYDRARTWEDPNDCGNARIISQIKSTNRFNTEHILELQLIPLFFQQLTEGNYISGQPAPFTPVDCSVFLSKANGGYDLLNAPIMSALDFKGGRRTSDEKRLPATWVMEAVGTTFNRDNFYLLQQEVNGMKKRVFANHSLVDSTRMAKLIKDTQNPGKALKEIKTAIGVWSYLNDPEVKRSFGYIFGNVTQAFNVIDLELSGRLRVYHLGPAWKVWFRDMVGYQVRRSHAWISTSLQSMYQVWNAQPSTNPQKALVLGHLQSLAVGLATYVDYDTSTSTFPDPP